MRLPDDQGDFKYNKINNMTEKKTWLIVRIIVAAIVVLFTVFAFSNQPCDLDAVYLSCRVTGSFGDILGFIMFYGFAAYVGGFLKLLGFDPWSNKSEANYVAFAVGVLGVILIWNL